MEIAKTLLHNQLFLGSKLSAVVQNNQKEKRKAEEGDETNKPPAKKLKQEPFAQKSSKVTYKAQIAEKTADVHAKLHLLANILGGNYPKYNGLITQRQLKYGGLICPLNRFSACSPNKRFENWCKFSVGTEEATGLFAVGLRADSGYVNKISSVKHNFPPHVVKVAKVFEKMVRVSEKASEDSVGRCQHQFWHELVIRTNEACELMLIVYVHGSEELALGRMERLNKELKEFFENGERNNYGITSIYTKVTYTTARIPPQLKLVVGSPYFEETVMDLKFQLQPTVHFWSNIDAARMVCTGVKQLLTPAKNNALLEVSFSGLGLVGLYLSRDVGEVLSVDAQRTAEEARKTATLNNITNCKYFDGSPEVVLHKVAENIKYNKACAVMICSGNNISACVKAMEELRKIEKVRRLVLVTEVFKSRFNFILTLCNPTRRKGRGNPFFPMRAIPVDTVPKGKGYVLLILMQRIGLLSLHQTVNQTVNDPAMQSTGKGPGNCRAAGIVMPYDKEARNRRMRQGDARLKIIMRREERELLQQRNEKYSFRVPEGHMFEGRMSGESHFYKQYPRTGQFDRPYSHTQSSVLEEGQLKDLKAKEWKRMMEKEEQQHWLEREEQRRWLEKEEHGKWIEEKELKRQIEEKKLKRWMEEERERELMRTGVNLRTTNSVVQDLIADSLRETTISQLSVETAQKLKQLIAEAVRSVGVIDQDERQSIFNTSRGIGGIHPRAVMSSQLRRSDKEMLEGDTHYVREVDYVHKHMEVDNVHQHKHNACGSAVGRHEDKQIPHSRHFEKVYSPSAMEISSLYQRRYEGESSGGSNNNLPHGEGENSYTRHIYHSDVNTSQMQEEKFSQKLNNYVSYEHLAGSYVRNAHQASQNIRPLFNSGMEKTSGSNVRLHAPNWNTVNAETNYIPLSDARKEIACSIPKPPGTDDAYFPGRSNYVYRDSVPGTSFRWQEDSTHTWY
ncbi:uncharacterized protein LOC110838976 isoform X2 [Zootermopsis nevadensis]|nr:uncharacterized protein LOC110838976 isoform X2 [Zootermopsis nevadensis]